MESHDHNQLITSINHWPEKIEELVLWPNTMESEHRENYGDLEILITLNKQLNSDQEESLRAKKVSTQS